MGGPGGIIEVDDGTVEPYCPSLPLVIMLLVAYIKASLSLLRDGVSTCSLISNGPSNRGGLDNVEGCIFFCETELVSS